MAEETTQDSLLGDQAGNSPEPWYGEGQKELVDTKGWKTGADAISSYTELEKSMGGRLKMPTPESSAEEVRAFYQKTGCPENPAGYELATPEGDFPQNESMENAIKQIAYDMGVSKQSFEAIVKGYYDQMSADMVATKESGEKVLREDLGDSYDEGIKIANRFLETCSDEFCTMAKQLGLYNNPIFIKEWIAKGTQTLSDTLIKGTADGDKSDGGYVPQYKDSPEMYAMGDDDESKKAREYFKARGITY
ncbi:hypothetical protein LCGC14_1221110 [marine sediment metagenome]|uniref:Uncharacterized protein n=1 Tax=marine sediment metagenome TaxID=412755 RepID=A0A0F9PFQ7_9ZZZZ